MLETGIFKLVLDAVGKNGELPEQFELPENNNGKIALNNDGKIGFAAGAKDGIMLYHTAPTAPSAETLKLVGQAIRELSAGNNAGAAICFAELGRRPGMVSLIDAIEDYVYKNQATLNPQKLFLGGVHLLLTAEDAEVVKTGLIMMSLINAKDDNARDAVRVIGLCDEFTLFAILNMSRWNAGNAEIFQLARHVHGWGRVHALSALQPQTREIADWILTDGLKNRVLESYSALEVYEKADVKGRIEAVLAGENMELKLWEAIIHVLAVMTRPGPVSSLSGISNPEGVIRNVVLLSEKIDVSDEARAELDELASFLAH